MRFRMLGPLEVRTGDDWQGIGARKWRSVLAALLLNAGQIVPTDSLVFELWGDEPPAKATNLISIYVLRLRRLIGDAEGRVLITRAPGYRLSLAPGDLDAQLFEALMADGRRALAAGKPQRAADLLTEALGLWRGTVLADVPPSALIEAEAERMWELRLTAMELRIEADLECGRSAQVIPELRRLVAENQIREGLWLLLMRALDASGRHAEALDTYAQAREVIADQLGVDPGVELQQLYQKILAADVPDVGVAADGVSTERPSADGGVAGEPMTVPGLTDEPDARGATVGSVPGTISVGTVAASPPTEGILGPPDVAPVAGEPVAGPAQPRPAQLPADIGDFTGRAGHVQHLCEMLTRGDAASGPGAVRIALVAGAGGLGKTTLAVHAAHQIRAQFPDGQLYVDLLGATAQPLAPGDVLARFLRDLGVDGARVPVGDDERAALYRTKLTGRRMLIVLDNTRDAAQVRPLLPGSASCAVLVTTRNRMYDLASTRLVDLNVLADSEALVLFTRIVGDERPEAEPDATAEVLLACAGLPLAIRICAARLAGRPRWKIGTMADRLRNEHRRLDELRAGDLAVRASFQVSYASLQAPDAPDGVDPARAFRLLGLWPGPTISLPAAAALLGQPQDDVADALEGLVDVRLLESPAPNRYAFHDLLKVYATERTHAEEGKKARDEAVERLLSWYLYTADTAAQVVSPHRYRMPLEENPHPSPSFASIEDALSWYDSERINLVAATRLAASTGLHDLAWRLPVTLIGVFNRRGNWSDAVATHQIAIESSRRAGNRHGEAWVLNNLGEALARKRMPEAAGYLEQALAIRREIGDREGEAQAANNLADVYLLLGRADEALEALKRSLLLQREIGHRYGEGIALATLGEVYLELGQYQQAIDCSQEALTSLREIGSRQAEVAAVQTVGRAYLGQGLALEASDWLRRALDIRRSIGDRYGEAVTLKTLGMAEHHAGRSEAAHRSWSEALKVFVELDDEAQAAEVGSCIASI